MFLDCPVPVNRIKVDVPIKSMEVVKTPSFKKPKEADLIIDELAPGDIFSVTGSSDKSVYKDGVYLVQYIQEEHLMGKAPSVVRLDKSGIEEEPYVFNPCVLDGKIKQLGHINVTA